MASTSNQNSPAQHQRKLFSYPLMASNKAISIDDSSNQNLLQQAHHQYHHHHPNNHQLSFGMMMQASSSSSPAFPGSFNNMNKEAAGSAYEMGELDQALFFYLDGQDHQPLHDNRQNSGMRPQHTLNIFPSQPMHVEPSKASAGILSPSTSGSKKSSEPSIDLSNPRLDPSASASAPASASQPPAAVKEREGNGKEPAVSTSQRDNNNNQNGPRTPDPKTLRRLAQNREAARKSRLRKKAYIQQLEASRVRLAQLEDELRRAKSQGFCIGGTAILGEQGVPAATGNINSDAAAFDAEYGRWLEEHHRLMVELRKAVDERWSENDLRVAVENSVAHFDQIMNLKGIIAKSDVFHLLSGMWRTPAERCFLWIGGFRPSELIKIIMNQIQPLTEQQLLGLCSLQQSTQEAEDALSQGLEALHASISETIAADSLLIPPNMNAYMAQMALAVGKLQTLEGFIRQADNLRLQMLHRLHHILSTRQAARCFLAIAEYFHRLRALSSLWLARPRSE